MSKTLVIAEKPSVGRDLARALGNSFKPSADKNALEGDDYVISWAVGHLVGLADPDKYDPKYKSWKLEDLPILPEAFQLEPNDANARKQLTVLRKLLKRDDVEAVINACDAGREGELIFAYIYDICKSKKPVRRLWLSSMTKKAIEAAFGDLRDGADMKSLEAAARSRSEADWIVGMNATRAATIQLRGAFQGKSAVSLGRVQTPTLALIANREIEINNFDPEPYWLVDALFAAPGSEPGAHEGERNYKGRFHMGSKPRLESAEAAQQIVQACTGKTGTITKLEKKQQKESPQLLYDLTSLQRDANTRFGFSAKRTLGAAQKLYEAHKALTYPRTSSRFLTADMAGEIKPIAKLLTSNSQFQHAAQYVVDLESLPLGRVVNDEKVEDHHAIIPTNAQHNLSNMGPDELKIYDLAVRRFLAIFFPDAIWERTSLETTVGEHIFRTGGRVLVTPGWRSVYLGVEEGESDKSSDENEKDQVLPPLAKDEQSAVREIAAAEKETKPPKRYSEASLLGAMETAGKDIDDAELREAMKESGIGTPATRSTIIERLINVGYIERDKRSLCATEKGVQVIQLLNQHPLTSPELTGNWEARLTKIEQGKDAREKFMKDIAKFAKDTVGALAKLEKPKFEGVSLGPCPHCQKPVQENRKGYSCWSKEDPGCGFVIWKNKNGKQITPEIATELMLTGKTAQAIDGFKDPRTNATFAAPLQMIRVDEKWVVDFVGDTPIIPFITLGPCPVCERPIKENRKGFSCWSPGDAGCGMVIWKSRIGIELTPEQVRQLAYNAVTDQALTIKPKGEEPRQVKLQLTRRSGKWSVEPLEEGEPAPLPAPEQIQAEQAKRAAEEEQTSMLAANTEAVDAAALIPTQE